MQMLFNTSNNLFYSGHLFLHDYPFLYEIFIHLERANFFFTYSTDLPTRSHTYGCIKVHLGRRNLFKPELNSTDKVYLFNFCCIFQFLNELLQIRICINIRQTVDIIKIQYNTQYTDKTENTRRSYSSK